MTDYQHDMMHCNQGSCPKKDSCYRYWLGQEIKNTDWVYASYYNPVEGTDLSLCNYYVKNDRQF